MIKSGDKIVYKYDIGKYYGMYKNNIYTIDYFQIPDDTNKYYSLKNINHLKGNLFIKTKEIGSLVFPFSWFITLLEFRKQKIKKICSNLEIE